MGEVWKARDTRLNRAVALKIAKAEFGERFARESRAVAALNHPNICQLYDVGPDYLVMELVEGQPLAGPMPAEQAVAIAGQILDALDAAHRKGITHRDLKPANILITRQGIKLLDFGLAKQVGQCAEGDATLSAALTAEGQILGTLHYMAPEQLQGQEADARSDLFAFGCVLYEMLAGRRAFEGSSVASVIAAVLEREPAPLALAPPLDRLIRRCLAKDPDERFQSARDLKYSLQLAMGGPAAPPATRRAGWPWMAAAVLAAAAVTMGWLVWHGLRAPASQPLLQVDLDLGEDAITDPAISPDGMRVAFVTRGQLGVRRLDRAKMEILAGTEGAGRPFFSPDGQWIAFFADGKLKKITFDGGEPVVLCDAPSGFGGSWGDDGNIVFAASSAGGLSRIAASGGKPVLAVKLSEGAGGYFMPQVLPRGRGLLFLSRPNRVQVVPPGGGEPKTLVENAYLGRFVNSGHLVYYQGNSLFAAPMDLDRLELTGPRTLLVEGVYRRAIYFAQADVSLNGSAVYLRGDVQHVVLSWLTPSRAATPLISKPGIYEYPRLSPDGTRVAITIMQGGEENVWNYDIAKAAMTRLTFGSTAAYFPTWSPDGEFLVFRAGSQLAWVRADGGGKVDRLTGVNAFPWSFSNDGRRLAVFAADVQGYYDLYLVPAERGDGAMRLGKPEALLEQPGLQGAPAISPDGRWLAYYSDESGRREIFVRPMPAAGPLTGHKWQISNEGGRYPIWSRNGSELFFESADNRVMVAGCTVRGDVFAAEKPRRWSETRLADTGTRPGYDVAPDGRRVLATMEAPGEAPKPETHLRLLVNVADELRRRATN